MTMINYGDSDIKRLLSAFKGAGRQDRVPYHEYFSINKGTCEAVLGQKIEDPSFKDRIELAQHIGLDALSLGQACWFPKGVKSEVVEGGQSRMPAAG